MTKQKVYESIGINKTNGQNEIKKFIVEIDNTTLGGPFYTMFSASNVKSAEKLAKKIFKTHAVSVVREING